MALELPTIQHISKEQELENAYDRMAAYARALKTIVLLFDSDLAKVSIADILHNEGVTVDDVSIDSFTSRIRIVHKGP